MKNLLYILLALALTGCAIPSDNGSSSHDEEMQQQQQQPDTFLGQRYQSTGDQSLLEVKLPDGVSNQTVKYDHITIYFNPGNRIPNCVAYELTNTQVAMADAPDAEQREDYKFFRDKKAENCPDWWEYKNSGYDRGHMAPAMDMRWNKTAMQQCFYMTNMCPQRHELNDGEWRHMEEAIHNWGRKNDRLVIFTGPILSKNMKKMGERHDIAIPGRFFKVVYAPASKRAIAFVMDNRGLEKSWTNYATTIDEVETLTGIDFLASLDDDIETAVESKQDIKQWPKYTPRR
ncbi:MAG: DNA/RNA non-specific endonuclease [Muribaculaceae bacterium]|nr:DNA/RNA non-specific endonuclease [Muribaculaceae bacterium]